MGFFVLLLVAATQSPVDPAGDPVGTPAPGSEVPKNGRSHASAPLTAITPSFIVRSYRDGPDADGVARMCDGLRRQLQTKWMGRASSAGWQPRCEVVLHATRSSYQSAVGRGAVRSRGSSLIQSDRGKVVSRRIDLLVSQRGLVTALPHELTHVVLADRFRGRRPPLWVDEGIATLADSEKKQALHDRDCHEALASGTLSHAIDIMTRDRLVSPRQVAPFYGQSLSLVRFLVQREGAAHFVSFVELALDKGYDRALAARYDIRGVAHLQRMWLDQLQADRVTRRG